MRIRWRPVQTVPSVTPNWSSAWGGPADTNHRRLMTSASGETLFWATSTATADQVIAPKTEYMQQLIATDLPEGPLTGRFRSVFHARAIFADVNAERRLRVIARVFDSTGTIDRGVIFDGVSSVLTSTTGKMTRPIGGNILPGVTAEAGDILVVELGGHIGAYAHANDHGLTSESYGPSSTIDDMPYVDGALGSSKTAWVELDIFEPTPYESLIWRPILNEPLVFPTWSSEWDGPGQSEYQRLLSSDPMALRYLAGTFASVSEAEAPRTEYMQQMVATTDLPVGELYGEFRSVWPTRTFYSNSQGRIHYLRVIARVFDATLTVERGVIFDGVSAILGATNDDVSRVVGGPILPGVFAQEDDVLVIEVGGHVGAYSDNLTHATTIQLTYGPTAEIEDLPYSDGLLSEAKSVWIEIYFPLPPGVPESLSEESTHREILFSWEYSSGAVDGYDIRINGGSVSDVGLSLSHTFEGLVSSTSYTLEVRSYGPRGNSAWASIVSTTKDSPWPFDWEAAERQYHKGVDHGVLYLEDGSGVVWNGLLEVEEEESIDLTPIYFDGIKVVDWSISSDYSATLRAWTYPDELDGLERIGLSYRSRQGRDIHVVYNVTAKQNLRASSSLTKDPIADEFVWSLNAVPIEFDGLSPISHLVINTDDLNSDQVSAIESALYGSVSTNSYLPSIEEIQEIIESLT